MQLVHERTNGMDCDFTPQRIAYPNLGRKEYLAKPWYQGSQTD